MIFETTFHNVYYSVAKQAVTSGGIPPKQLRLLSSNLFGREPAEKLNSERGLTGCPE
jgi:hypothetical protein